MKEAHDRVPLGERSLLAQELGRTPFDRLVQNMLVWTVLWLNNDQEFVARVPGLYQLEAFTHNGDAQRNVGTIFAVLLGLMGSHEFLPWSIIQLAKRASTSKLPKQLQQRRTGVSLMALFHIPGAIRDVLAPYVVGEHHCLEILPLLNSPDLLEIIEGLWDSPIEDVALSVRCAAAVVSAFMINPPRLVLDDFVDPDIRFIWNNDTGKRFLANWVGIDANGHSDNGRLKSIVRFFADIKDGLRLMNAQWWTSDNAHRIHRKRRELFEKRHAAEYRIGIDVFDQQGDRASPWFMPAAQQDLIVITRDTGAGSRRRYCDAAARGTRDAYTQFVRVALTQAWAQSVFPGSVSKTLVRIRVQAGVNFRSGQAHARICPSEPSITRSRDATSPPQMQIVLATAAATVRPDDGPSLHHSRRKLDLLSSLSHCFRRLKPFPALFGTVILSVA
ncbi:hypothetical protein H4582DRAFT_1942063 [Lactarius indigo]|nr:hypothetical protein H4582DRAFT_1942063 [Lactarius indigo]